MPTDHNDYFVCPACGDEVPARALACPTCGADDETGWSEAAAYDGLDLPTTTEEDFDRSAQTRRLAKSRRHKAILILMVLLILIFVIAQAT